MIIPDPRFSLKKCVFRLDDPGVLGTSPRKPPDFFEPLKLILLVTPPLFLHIVVSTYLLSFSLLEFFL